MNRVMIIGAGAWGTALAIQAARAGNGVTLWARDPAIAQAIATSRENPRLPGHRLPDAVQVVDALPASADAALLVVPMQHVRSVLNRLQTPAVPLVVCIKGVESGTLRLPLEVVLELRPGAQAAVLTGPNFAHEIAAGLPAAAVIAATDAALRDRITATARHAVFSPVRQRRSDRRPGRWRGEERDRHRGRCGDRRRPRARTPAPR